MSKTATQDDGREPVTRRVHRRQWVADRKSSSYAGDSQLLPEAAAGAVEQTVPVQRIDIGTHRRRGQPSTSLYPRLESMLDGIGLADDGCRQCSEYATRMVV